MKRVLFLSLLLFISLESFAQVRLGIKGGLSTFDIEAKDLSILNNQDVETYKLGIDDAKYGIHLGFFLQIKASAFFAQPEILFNSNTINYRLEDISTGNIEILDESYQQLDIPLIVGLRAGPVRVGAGPVGHLPISSTSDLTQKEGYVQAFDMLTWGWQAGIGLDFWKLHIDARYEGNLSKYGEHLIFYGKSYPFDAKPTRLIASLGISF